MKIKMSKANMAMLVIGGGVAAYFIYKHFFSSNSSTAEGEPPLSEIENNKGPSSAVEEFEEPTTASVTGSGSGDIVDVVLFSRRGCPPCDQLKSGVWPQVAQEISSRGIRVTDHDVEQNPDFPPFVKGTPTIAAFTEEGYRVYDGPRTVEDILSFVFQ